MKAMVREAEQRQHAMSKENTALSAECERERQQYIMVI